MKTFLVNLDRSADRLAEADAELARAGVAYARARAVDGAALTAEERAANVSRFHMYRCLGRRLRPAEIGCALSHLNVHRQALDENLPFWAVLEDDVVIDAAAWNQAVARIEQTNDPAVPTVWLMSDGHGLVPPSAPAIVRLLGAQRGILHTWGTLGYALNAAAAKRIRALAWPVRYTADAWSTYCRKGVDVRVVFPTAVRERPASSLTSTVLEKRGHGRLWVWYGSFVRLRYVICFWLDVTMYRVGRLFRRRCA